MSLGSLILALSCKAWPSLRSYDDDGDAPAAGWWWCRRSWTRVAALALLLAGVCADLGLSASEDCEYGLTCDAWLASLLFFRMIPAAVCLRFLSSGPSRPSSSSATDERRCTTGPPPPHSFMAVAASNRTDAAATSWGVVLSKDRERSSFGSTMRRGVPEPLPLPAPEAWLLLAPAVEVVDMASSSTTEEAPPPALREEAATAAWYAATAAWACLLLSDLL
jgi:hypothetical protein